MNRMFSNPDPTTEFEPAEECVWWDIDYNKLQNLWQLNSENTDREA